MTADRDEVITYPTPNYPRKTGHCRLRVWWRGRPTPLAVLTELDDNPSASITNAAEQVYAKVQRLHPGAVVVEHYPARQPGQPDRFAVVTIVQRGAASCAAWESVHPDLLPEVTDNASAP